MPDLLNTCKEIAKHFKNRSVDEYEIYASSSIDNDIEVFKGKIDSLSFSDSKGIGIRVFIDNAIGYSYTSILDDKNIINCIDSAIENTKITTKENLNALPSEREFLYSNKLINASLVGSKYSKFKPEDKTKATKELEKLTIGKDKRIKGVDNVIYQDNFSEIALLNSNGFLDSYKATTCFMYVSAIAKDKDDTSTGDYFGFGRDLSQINLDNIASNAAQRSVSLLGGKKIKSKKMNLILDPLVAAQLLGVIANALTADSVQKGKSIFKDKLGEKIFSIGIDIYDDGIMENGMATAPFDGEGVYKGKTAVIKGGVLKTFLHNIYTARKDNTKSTGNGDRASYRSIPSVGISNFYIRPGNKSAESIIREAGNGFLVKDIIGLHSGVNPISGDISVGAKGILIKNGDMSNPVKEVTIATNFLDLCKNIKGVADDLKFIPSSGYIGSPTMLVEDIMVAGT